ncbi:ABC transporter ATP-binding protein [Lihuaxuella thermophila]|uniref:ATP-binding cassette, subfamily B n=1 Tax=Lihuaxuella thermophila TaxID=1173111 RepID=A0A1H8G5Y7_9BACL|nr:ABC transporter ATP-binding protein [Lihuaxuella thermophila]SEN39165.1 ATP-binding cassette, subfamily B [Lihuaxuella thermophila]
MHIGHKPNIAEPSSLYIWKRVVHLSGGRWGIVAGLSLLVLAQACLSPMTPLIIAELVDHGFSGTSAYSFSTLLLALFGVAILQSLFYSVQSLLITGFSTHIVMNLRKRLFAKIQEQSIRFFTEEKSGEIMSRLTSETHSMGDTVLKPILFTVQSGLTIVVTLFMMFALNWKLSLLILVVVPLMFLPVSLFGKLAYKTTKQLLNKNSESQSFIAENLTVSGMMLSKLFNSKDSVFQRYSRLLDTIRDLTLKQSAYGSAFSFILSMGTSIAPILVYWFGRPGSPLEVSAGIAVAFAAYIGTLFNPIQQMGQLGMMLKGARAMFERILSYMDMEPDLLPVKNPVNPDQIKGQVEFKDVSVSYDKRHPVLKEINLKIAAGEKVYIVGKSGAGKTTLAYLVCRLLDPQSGQVLLDGIDIRQLASTTVHRFVGVLSQEVYLLHDTIRENIMLANPEASEAQMIEAARRACIHEKIMQLEHGYDTVVGERGYKLSGGEKQRIAIARMFLKNPQILVLDEPTSALDSQSEKWVQASLESLIEKRTVLVIAHRLSGIRPEDRIIVLDKGSVIQEGLHHDLIRQDGLYASLYKQFHSQDIPAQIHSSKA